ncbi:ribonuclease P protein subunit p40-like [Phymastichus coffea]|uniref:ribonuclease P protein subunit p40-like n=1 Tax=Phymastichus coffea TaxID=108790 RepID=UPI00273AD600|nr:ribonuclease P protein subunit p40-like [Phymastichus coffea]
MRYIFLIFFFMFRCPFCRYLSQVVTIDLKDDKLTPGKKYYERIRNCLNNLPDLTFDVILSWDPPEENVCPSSVAAWFQNRGYSVSVCHIQPIRRVEYSLDIPVLNNTYNLDDFFEWLGIFSVGGNLKNETEHDKYVSSYNYSTPKMEVGQVQYLQFTGFFSRLKVEKIYKMFKAYANSNNNLPWCSMDVQGFADSPVSWGLKEHTFYIDGDNSFTIVLRPGDEGYILRKSLSSNNIPKNTQ